MLSEQTLEMVPGLETPLGCDLMVGTCLNTKYSFSKSCPFVAQTAVLSAATYVRIGTSMLLPEQDEGRAPALQDRQQALHTLG